MKRRAKCINKAYPPPKKGLSPSISGQAEHRWGAGGTPGSPSPWFQRSDVSALGCGLCRALRASRLPPCSPPSCSSSRPPPRPCRLLLTPRNDGAAAFSQHWISLLSSSRVPRRSPTSPLLEERWVVDGPGSCGSLMLLNLRLNKAIKWGSANLHKTSLRYSNK